ncbi:MAG TPA: anthranilate phosphoribosyltransferase [Acidobacteriaceae bacterium]
MSFLKDLLKPMAEDGSTLTREQARSALIAILDGQANDTEAAALLSVLATRGELAPELAGFVEEIRARATPIPLTEEERDELIDTCGTGGGGPTTFNISTGAALVVAAAGAKVAKHGNRAVTSRCGSADVLEALGVPIALSPELAVECLRETGFVFLLATMLHPAMKAVAPLRKALGFRTIFNLCGPLTNPARARSQVIGTLAPSRALLMARTLVELNAADPNSVKSAFVVHGLDGLDELTLTGESIAVRVDPAGEPVIKAARVTPEMAGLPRASLDDLSGGNAEENAAHLYDVLTAIPGPRRDVVLFNAAAALVAGGHAADLKEGVAQASEAIDSGMAAVTLQKLRSFGERYKS